MSLLPFLLLTGLGSVAVVAIRARPRAATILGVAILALAVIAAALIRPSQSIAIGSSGIATTEYLRVFLLLAALATLLLAIVAEATDDRGDAPAVALGILATCGLALALPDARVAVLAATVALEHMQGQQADCIGCGLLVHRFSSQTPISGGMSCVGLNISNPGRAQAAISGIFDPGQKKAVFP